MNHAKQLAVGGRCLAIALLGGALSALPVNLNAAEQNTGQRHFASPEEAVKALRQAASANDRTALRGIFGPEFDQIVTGDKVQDAANTKQFASHLGEGYKLVPQGGDKFTVEVGANEWPMPIPLVKVGAKWHFDTPAGKEEIVNRHIGADELHAIGICRAYVAAQRQYASLAKKGSKEATKEVRYAQKFKSSPGKKDGLYWPTGPNEQPSPFDRVMGEALAEGKGPHNAKLIRPFHGYYFKILTRQGEAAPGGKMDYVNHGDLSRGFALVAYPARWNRSGIMTFIANEDGRVFQRDLGEKTAQIARAMTVYNPDTQWTLVRDEGMPSSVAQQ